jgi:phosphatidylcholine synthase
MQLAAALVHVFTALGIVCALFATQAISDKSWTVLFAWLGVAFLIDGIDGTFARMVNVGVQLPRFSGERLDLVIDYVTYVYVPAWALVSAGFLPGDLGFLLAALILLSSLFHFSDEDSKADDLSFVGFPAIWNIVAFYLFAFAVPASWAMAIVTLCVVLTFVPMKWVHPLRVERLMGVTIVATLAWSAAAIAIVWHGFEAPPFWARAVLVAVLLYGAGLAVLSFRGPRTS